MHDCFGSYDYFCFGEEGGGGGVSSAIVLMSSYKNNANNYNLGYKLVACATHFFIGDFVDGIGAYISPCYAGEEVFCL